MMYDLVIIGGGPAGILPVFMLAARNEDSFDYKRVWRTNS